MSVPRSGCTVSRRALKKLVAADAGQFTTSELKELFLARPKVRADCVDGPRPCPFMGCRYHLGLEEKPLLGSLRLPFGEEPDFDAMPDTCALDVADRGGTTLEEVGRRMGVTREYIRQLEERALEKLKRRGALVDFSRNGNPEV